MIQKLVRIPQKKFRNVTWITSSKSIQTSNDNNEYYNNTEICNRGKMTGEKSNCLEIQSENIFPENTHWIVFVLTLFFRIIYVSDKMNWWILHPDEIFQSLENAC
ncbi:hypothetical protein KUTeg_009675 [Tegillarca granosa]|uniref:Uncharacterized protein n=1 Tax=Tegillarca granosa TaxID=220873 RepID=A0ABQ9F7Q2_TEGGR|nr:hypothetical protein KUTeg_009675 [Tegillarca granosa]